MKSLHEKVGAANQGVPDMDLPRTGSRRIWLTLPILSGVVLMTHVALHYEAQPTRRWPFLLEVEAGMPVHYITALLTRQGGRQYERTPGEAHWLVEHNTRDIAVTLYDKDGVVIGATATNGSDVIWSTGTVPGQFSTHSGNTAQSNPYRGVKALVRTLALILFLTLPYHVGLILFIKWINSRQRRGNPDHVFGVLCCLAGFAVTWAVFLGN
jgi:hypothetical protein